jgi:hypothetical protein
MGPVLAEALKIRAPACVSLQPMWGIAAAVFPPPGGRRKEIRDVR